MEWLRFVSISDWDSMFIEFVWNVHLRKCSIMEIHTWICIGQQKIFPLSHFGHLPTERSGYSPDNDNTPYILNIILKPKLIKKSVKY